MSQKIEKFGSYALLEKIASGGMAEIYLARSTVANGLNKFVAVKRILPHLTNDQEFVTMFQHEAKIAINLNHNNLVSIFYFGCENNQYYLVMDYIEGKTVHQIVSELKNHGESLAVDQVLYLIKEAAAGLDNAHRCVDTSNNKPLGVIHRDVSPQNIMLSFDGAVKVIDFGIAKAGNRNITEVGTFKGKFSYMSPEQGEGLTLDHRSDIFSLGVVLWELLANEQLFSGNTNLEILRNVKKGKIKSLRSINSSIPPELEKIVNRSLAKDRNERYQTAADFGRDLNRLLNMHYPSFSPLEFSKQIKKLFYTEYEKRREALVQYSNLQLDNIKSSEVFENTTANKTVQNNIEPVDVYQPAPPEDYQNPVLSVVSNVSDLPDGFEQLTSSGTDSSFTAKHDFVQLAQSTPAQPHEDISDHSKYVAPISVLIKNNQPEPEKKIVYAAQEPEGDRYVRFAIVLSLVVMGYFGFSKFIMPNIKKSMVAQDVSNEKSRKLAGALPPAPKSASTVVAAPVKTTYQKALESKKGYLNISLSEENPDVRILVNGLQLIEKPPLLMYPVVAEREISITALNIKTNKSVEKKILVKSEESMDLQIDLSALTEEIN